MSNKKKHDIKIHLFLVSNNKLKVTFINRYNVGIIFFEVNALIGHISMLLVKWKVWSRQVGPLLVSAMIRTYTGVIMGGSEAQHQHDGHGYQGQSGADGHQNTKYRSHSNLIPVIKSAKLKIVGVQKAVVESGYISAKMHR
jgi:hypothetical protein